MRGTIDVFMEQRGFGFILPDDDRKQVFVHISDMPNQKPLPRHTKVSYELGSHGGRVKAVKVEVVQ